MTVNIIENERQPVTLNDTYEAWYKLKTRYRDAIVILRNGDNYYAFEDDADTITNALQKEPLPLWKERQLCILPYHEIDDFLNKVVKAGYRAAICEPVFFSLFQ